MAAAMAKGIMLRWLATRALAVVNISATPMEKAREVSLTSVMTSLPMAGRIRLTTWGKMIRKKVWARE